MSKSGVLTHRQAAGCADARETQATQDAAEANQETEEVPLPVACFLTGDPYCDLVPPIVVSQHDLSTYRQAGVLVLYFAPDRFSSPLQPIYCSRIGRWPGSPIAPRRMMNSSFRRANIDCAREEKTQAHTMMRLRRADSLTFRGNDRVGSLL